MSAHSNDSIKFSIIIATYNRLNELKELISSVEKFTFPKDAFELIISDDGSTDGTKQFIENYAANFNLRYIHQENKGPGEARNHGMREAKGNYFIFIDSDCIIPADYLQKIDDYLSKTHLDAFGGPDTYHESFPPMIKAINYSMTSFIGTGGTRGSKKSVTKFYPRSFNMGISREIFKTIGGMSKLRHGQDMDLSARIYEAGFKVGLIENAFVYHKRRSNLKKFFKQVFNWGVTRINLGRMYNNMLKPIHLMPAFIVASIILAIILSFFLKYGSFLLFAIGLGAMAIALFAFFQSLHKYKNLKVAFLSIFTLYIQVIAYGLGTWSGIFQVLSGKKTAKGFTKNYYK